MKTINNLRGLLVLVFLGIMSFSCNQEETMILIRTGVCISQRLIILILSWIIPGNKWIR